METIYETHLISLRFKLDKSAPPEYENRWNELKRICETGETGTKQIVQEWLAECKTCAMRNLPYLNRYEGGIGSDDSKQIRFRSYYNIHPYKTDDDIVFDQIYNTDNHKWSLTELSDLIYGFIEFANKYVRASCVSGVIELEQK